MITAKRVRDETTILFERVQVDYEGCTYAGPGFGRWRPDCGLSVNGIMKSVGGKRPSRVDFGVPKFTDRSRLSTIRLRTRAKEHGVIFMPEQWRRTHLTIIAYFYYVHNLYKFMYIMFLNTFMYIVIVCKL